MKIILGCIALIVMCGAMTGCTLFGDKEQTNVNNPGHEQGETEVVEENDKYIQYTDDGTRINTSSKIANATKRLGDLEFRNIKLSENVNITTITADVYNMGTEKIMEKMFSIKLLDDKNELIVKINAMVGTIEPGESAKLSADATLDYANAYDIEFVEYVSEK